MNDLRRWPDGDPNELESRLLAAARGERVPAVLRERMASGLTASLSGGLATSASAARGLLFSKAKLWGVLALIAIAVPAFHALRTTHRDATPRATRQSGARDATPAAPIAVLAVERAASEPAPASEPAAAVASRDSSALRAEVALLDRARRALRSGSGDDALALLARHDRAFSAGALMPEAEALRIETLLHQGDRQSAAQRYKRFSARYPEHPLGERIARLLERE